MATRENKLLDGTHFNCETAKIMVVDDESVITSLVEVFLESNGFKNILCLNDSKQALQAIHSFDPDLMLLDILMPTLGGLELLEKIRADEAHDDLVVLMLSAASKSLKYKALRLGAVDFVDKPVDAAQLAQKVRDSLRIL